MNITMITSTFSSDSNNIGNIYTLLQQIMTTTPTES